MVTLQITALYYQLGINMEKKTFHFLFALLLFIVCLHYFLVLLLMFFSLMNLVLAQICAHCKHAIVKHGFCPSSSQLLSSFNFHLQAALSLQVLQDTTCLLQTLHGSSFQKGNHMPDGTHSDFYAATREHERDKGHLVTISSYPPLAFPRTDI